MQKEHYLKILEQVADFRIGVDNYFKSKISGRPRKDGTDNEPAQPINAYPVVLAYHERQVPCEWCEDRCSSQKTYRRPINSQLWDAKCSDCGLSRKFHTTQINSDK
jgi:hypothetical protein